MLKTAVILCFTLIVFSVIPVQAQSGLQSSPQPPVQDTSKKNQITVSAEFRFRSDYRHGYRYLMPKEVSDTTAAFLVLQRTRLNVAYNNKNLDVFLSLQDARVWGEQNQRGGRNVPLYLFEAYVEPKINPHLSVRIGRQRLVYDNQRLFSENEWRNAGASYDAARLIYKKGNVHSDIFASFNQTGENFYNTTYKPAGFTEYKVLLGHYLKWKASNSFQLTAMNVADGFQSYKAKETNTTLMRYTTGGRIELFQNEWYFTTAAYYQFGKDSSGKKLAAYYLQPEVKYTNKSVTVRLGAELLSGTPAEVTNVDHSFVTLYGSPHRFNGNLDLFTSFPRDLNNAGLINPYLFLNYSTKKWGLNFENHLFYSQKDFYDVNKTKMGRYLGYEADARINYKANAYTMMEFGASLALGTESMAVIKNPVVGQGYYSTNPYLIYFMLHLKPSLFQFKF